MILLSILLPNKKITKYLAQICNWKHLKKSNKYGMVFNRRKIVLAIIGERGVMKIKIFGFAAMLSLAALLGACDSGGGGGTSGEPAATTSPAAGEPADGGAMMSPSASPGGAMTAPSATTPATPSATKSP
jgi:hypothetical protein